MTHKSDQVLHVLVHHVKLLAHLVLGRLELFILVFDLLFDLFLDLGHYLFLLILNVFLDCLNFRVELHLGRILDSSHFLEIHHYFYLVFVGLFLVNFFDSFDLITKSLGGIVERSN